MNKMIEINEEKQKIIEQPGDVLVTANPGTGKTLLLAHKYAYLIENGIDPSEILCLTFTRKAKREMENRIINILDEKGLDVDLSNLNIHTFHSYALDCLDVENIISTNLIRYTIYDYLKENEVLNYSDRYLIGTLIPKLENAIRYLKSFGILPSEINIEEVKRCFKEDTRFSKEEMEVLLRHFVKMYETYEEEKGRKECDYEDLLVDYLQVEDHPVFEYVLVDELQDLNRTEAEIALESGRNFFVVGDRKQAIFGFQGGSIRNFKKFQDAKQFTLSENFRSTDQILRYARRYFMENTSREEYEEDLRDLRSSTGKEGEKPLVLSGEDREDKVAIACNLAQDLVDGGEEVAIIVRTNNQISDISDELEDRGLEHASTYLSASERARGEMVDFIKSVLSKDIDLIKKGMFTPYFPVPLQDAFKIAEDRRANLEDIYEKAPKFKGIRENLNSIEDINRLFEERIIPISISYGEEFFLAALEVKRSFNEAMNILDNRELSEVINYLRSSDLKGTGSSKNNDLVVTTVHKAKGREFENVIYVPKRTRGRSSFADEIVEAILLSKGIDVSEEFEEESLRIDFVAIARTEEELYIVHDNPGEFLNDHAEMKEPLSVDTEDKSYSESKKRAYSLFVNREFEKAKELLETEESWIRDFVKKHFEEKRRLSYSHLTKEPYYYLKDRIFSIVPPSPAMKRGGEIHDLAEKVVKGREVECREELEPYVENVRELMEETQNDYPTLVGAEENFSVQLSDLMEEDQGLVFTGKIDAIFKNEEGEYLLVDWKTSKRKDRGSKYRRQLETYRRAFSVARDIPLENIRVAIGYVGLRKRVNDGTIRAELVDRQPYSNCFDTIKKRVNLILSWMNNVDKFFEDLKDSREENHLIKSVLEQYKKEKSN